jgi:hypothetical protein
MHVPGFPAQGACETINFRPFRIGVALTAVR